MPNQVELPSRGTTRRRSNCAPAPSRWPPTPPGGTTAHSLLAGRFWRAVALADLGRASEAVAELAAAAEQREPGVVALAVHPSLRRLSGASVYEALRNEVFAGLRRSETE